VLSTILTNLIEGRSVLASLVVCLLASPAALSKYRSIRTVASYSSERVAVAFGYDRFSRNDRPLLD
jgi:hypothetical protein